MTDRVESLPVMAARAHQRIERAGFEIEYTGSGLAATNAAGYTEEVEAASVNVALLLLARRLGIVDREHGELDAEGQAALDAAR